MLRAALWLMLAVAALGLRIGMPPGDAGAAMSDRVAAGTMAHAVAADATPAPEEAAPLDAPGARQADAGICSPEQFAELRRRREALDRRAEDLARRERRLQEAEARARALAETLQARIAALDERLAAEKKLKGKKIKRLAAVYAAMKPAAAAAVVARLDLATAIRIFSVMDEKRVGKILSNLPPETAVRISRGLARPATRR